MVLPQETEMQLVASTGFSILRFDSPEEAVFYHGWLRSDEAAFQLLRWNSGGTYPAIDHEVPGGILVPEFSSDLVKSRGTKWKLKFLGLEMTERLTTAAKCLVETTENNPVIYCRDLMAMQYFSPIGTTEAKRIRKGFDYLKEKKVDDDERYIRD